MQVQHDDIVFGKVSIKVVGFTTEFFLDLGLPKSTIAPVLDLIGTKFPENLDLHGVTSMREIFAVAQKSFLEALLEVLIEHTSETNGSSRDLTVSYNKSIQSIKDITYRVATLGIPERKNTYIYLFLLPDLDLATRYPCDVYYKSQTIH